MSPLKELSRAFRREFGSSKRRRRFERIDRAHVARASVSDRLRACALAWVLCFGSILLFGNALHFLIQHAPDAPCACVVETQRTQNSECCALLQAIETHNETHVDCPICEFFTLCRTLVFLGASAVFLTLIAFRFVAASSTFYANRFLFCFNGRAPPLV